MSAAEDEPLDDADIQDPWDRMQRLGGAIEVIADRRDPRQVTRARQLLESLEMQIKEDDAR